MRVLYNDYINHKEERTMKTIYFATRTLARNAKDELNGQFKDFGTGAPKGERWAVLVEDYLAAAYDETQDKHEEWKRSQINIDKLQECTDNLVQAVEQTQQITETAQKNRSQMQQDINELHYKLRMQGLEVTPQEAKSTLNRPGSIIGEQTLKTPNNKPVSVYWRRNVERTRMAHNLEKTM